MRFDIGYLLGTSTNDSNGKLIEEVVSDGTLFGEEEEPQSSFSMGTLLTDKKGNDAIGFSFMLSDEFVADNYQLVGVSPDPITAESSDYQLWGMTTEQFKKDTNGEITKNPTKTYTQDELIYDANEYFEKQGFQGRFQPSLNYFYVYPGAIAANGKIYPIGDGEKIRFRFEKAVFKQTNAYENEVVVRLNRTEQALSFENYEALVVTQDYQGDNIFGYTSLSGNYVEKPINFSTRDSSYNLMLYNLPKNYNFTAYFYKKTKHGKFYYMGMCECTSPEEEQEEKKPACQLDIQYNNKVLDNGVICYDYPILKSSSWINFCDDINTVRLKAGLVKFSFTLPLDGNNLTFSIFNEAVTAIKAIYNKVGTTIPADLQNAISKTKCDSNYFNGLNDSLIKIRDIIYK